MEKQLPKNWVETTLGKISKIVTGNTPSKNNKEFYGNYIPWVKPGDINTANVLYSSEENLSAAGLKKARLVPKGSIMVTCIGNLGNVAMAGVDMTTNQQINSIVLDHNLLCDKYLLFYSITLKKWLIENSTSTTISMVNKSNFEKAPILLPPLAEQKRIAEKLDALFGQLDSVRGAMNHIPTLLANLRQQILTHAVTGKLTQEWREGKNLEGWKSERADECCIKVQSGGTPKGGNFSTVGIPFLKVYNIVQNKIDFEYQPQYVTNEIQNTQIKKSITYPGDVIMNIVGPPLNKIAIIPSTYSEWNINQAITLFRTKNYLMKEYLYYFFCEGSSVNSLINETRGVVGQVNISLSQCRAFIINIPPKSEQEEIVNRVQSLVEKLDSIEQRYQMLKTTLENLPQAILHKAFKGELVEQLPSDGNATDLLREIEQLKKSLKKK